MKAATSISGVVLVLFATASVVSMAGALGGSDGVGIVLIVLVVVVPMLALWVWLAGLPGRIARSRGHADADAIRLCGLVGLVLPIAWVVAIVWAHTANSKGATSKPKPAADGGSENAQAMIGNAFCPSCGKQRGGYGLFCGKCGRPFPVPS